MTNGLSHPYHLDESCFIFRGSRGNSSFFDKIMLVNRIAPDGTTRFTASHLELFCLRNVMSHKNDARLYGLTKLTGLSQKVVTQLL